jgi:5-methylcytosine-specific restriction endonuclease McrA
MKVAEGHNPKQYRLDQCGNLVFYRSYGKRSEMSWQIDHIQPRSKGGSDDLDNLIGMHWRQNASKGNKYPYDYDECRRNPKGVRG